MGAVRIDSGAEGPGALLLTDEELASYNAVKVQECGGEPAQQKWAFDKPSPGQISNDNGKICLNVAGCETEMIYDGCEKPAKPCGTVRHTLRHFRVILGQFWVTFGSLCVAFGLHVLTFFLTFLTFCSLVAQTLSRR
jgi:hypothetical protein